MDSAICLAYSPLPTTAPLHRSSRTIRVRANRVHLSLSHASLCLSHCSMSYPSAHASRHVNCVLENEKFSLPSNNEGSDNPMMRGMTGISLVMACVLGVFNFSSKMNPKSVTAYAFDKMPAPTSHPNEHLRIPTGAESAVDSLLKMIKHLHSDCQPPQISENPSIFELEQLKLYAVGQIKSGKHEEAVKLLQRVYDKLEVQSEAELYMEMVLIEILILQENYIEALKRLDERINRIVRESEDDNSNHDKVTNDNEKIELLEEYEWAVVCKPKIFLYKALLHSKLGMKDAQKWGEAFGKTFE